MTQQGYYQQPPPPPQYPPQYAQPNRFHLHGDIVQRFIALLIDGIIIFIILAVVTALFVVFGVFASFGGVLGFFSFSVSAVVFSVVWFLVVFLYFVVQEGGANNTTIGKNAMNLKVVNEQYGPIDMSTAAVRNLMRALWSLPFMLGFAFFVIDVIMVLVREDKQRLGDIVSHTYVVREDATYGPQPYYAPPPQYAPPPPQYQQQPPPPGQP